MSIVTPVYTTRESVKAAPELRESVAANTLVDDAIAAATESIHGQLHRRFYPQLATRYFDWPNYQYARPWRLWLDSNELASVVTFTVNNGSTILTEGTDFILRRSDDVDEAPYDQVEILLSGSASFSSRTTHQRAIAITGVYMGCPATTAAAGILAEALDSTETGVDVSNSAAIGVGQIIKVDNEWMIVSDKSMLSTGQTLQTPLTADSSNTTVMVTGGSDYAVGETLLLDSERMLITDIAGNTLTVARASEGSVLATHTGSTIYAPRTLSVVRGALGSTAASHSTSAAIAKHVVPALVRQLADAEAIVQLANKSAAYARVVGEGENARQVNGRSLYDLRKDAYAAHGRQLRMGAV